MESEVIKATTKIETRSVLKIRMVIFHSYGKPTFNAISFWLRYHF